MTEKKMPPSQAFMDSLFTKKIILQNERMIGRSWYSPGGEAPLKDFLLKIKLQPGNRVLEIGCGSGASAFYMAKFWGASVRGVDISTNMIDTARERLDNEDKEIRDKVDFVLADASQLNYEPDSYDVILCRYCIVFIADKEHLFKNFYKWLKPGGSLFVEEICGGDKQPYSKGFLELIKRRRYDLRTITDITRVLEAAGFKNVEATDDTTAMSECIKRDIENFQPMRDAFVKDFNEDDYVSIVKDWKDRLTWSRAGEHLWGSFQAKK